MHPNDKRLFEYVHTVGEVVDYKGLIIIDNTGPKANGQLFYRCIVKGGILFDISKEHSEDNPGEWMYCCDIDWPGPWDAKDSTDILGALTLLNHGVIDK